MLVCSEHRLLFIHPPKTGGGSLRAALQHCGFVRPPEVPASDWHCWKVPAAYASWTVFGTIRNPYARFASWYAHVMGEPRHPSRAHLAGYLDAAGLCDFTTFVQVTLDKGCPADFQPLVVMLRNARFLLRQERLAEEFTRLPFVRPNLALPGGINAFPHPPWRGCYTAQTAALVRDRYAGDFWSYGYPEDI
jgi:hypothetical protein